MTTTTWFALASALLISTGCDYPSPPVPDGGTRREMQGPTVGPAPCGSFERTWEVTYRRTPTAKEIERCHGRVGVRVREVYCCSRGAPACRLVVRAEECP